MVPWLGLRRNARDYSVHLRPFGKCSGERLKQKLTLKADILIFQTLVALKLKIRRYILLDLPTEYLKSRFRRCKLLGIIATAQFLSFSVPRLIDPPETSKIIHHYDTLDQDFYIKNIRFMQAQVEEMAFHLNIPDFFSINDGVHAWNFDGQHAFLYYLYRFRSLDRNMSKDREKWSFDCTTLGKVFNVVCNFIDENHGHRLRNLEFASPSFPRFNQAIINMIIKNGHRIPDQALATALFGDCCRYRVCSLSVCFLI